MVPPSFTPDSRLPPHQQHRKQIHFLYTDGICLFIARHVNVCQSVAAYLLLTACIHPSIRHLSSGCSTRSYVFGAQLRDVFAIYGIMRLSSAGSFLFSPDITTCSLPSLFLYLLPILLHHPRFCQGLFRIRSSSASIPAAAPSLRLFPGLSTPKSAARLPAYKIPAQPAEVFPQ